MNTGRRSDLASVLAAIAAAAAAPVHAAEKSADAVARELADPNTSLAFLSFPIDYTSYKGDLPDADSQSAFRVSFQPSIPYPIGDKADKTNFFFRPLIPVYFDQPFPVIKGSPVGDEEVKFEDTDIELGDISFDAAIGKTFDNGVRLIGGIVGTVPTATDDNVGLDQWLLGPELFVGYGDKWGLVGLLLSHQWDVAGEDDYDTSITGGQYFYTVNVKDGWQIQAQPTFSYNHEADNGDEWTFPLGIGVAKTAIIGNTPWNFKLQYWHYIEQPDPFGPDYQIRFQVSPVIPLPW